MLFLLVLFPGFDVSLYRAEKIVFFQAVGTSVSYFPGFDVSLYRAEDVVFRSRWYVVSYLVLKKLVCTLYYTVCMNGCIYFFLFPCWGREGSVGRRALI